ncbi:hypothetical protein [Cellulomonas sp. URHE0023]|uniref:hypothetical protein n=1 Tax=Cellulomonas sp. URHE0023 TaxID=1380354 RepID=UPI0012DF1CF0|nr:hypothetical protein [Cellulomonas sp. URHE0023]
MASMAVEHAATMARQAAAQTRQCSDIDACISHSAAQASPMAMQLDIIEVMTPIS